MTDFSKLSVYQDSRGTLKERRHLVPRIKDRIKMIDWKNIEGRTILDIGCNNGNFVREAMRRGATRAVGVDISDCIIGARELAKEEKVNAEFWQVDVESEEFRNFCPRFDVIFLFSVLTNLKDKERFLDWLDYRLKYMLYFESNHGEVNKQHIDLVQKHIWFESFKYLGQSDIPEKPHYMWQLRKQRDEVRYKQIGDAPIEFISVDSISSDETMALEQKNKYDTKSEKFQRLKADIKEKGIRTPIVLKGKNRDNRVLTQGIHRFLAAKELGYKDVPCKIL